MSDPLHIIWRPTELDEVIGQDAVVTNLKRLFEADRVPHTFLFTGPSGTGKTTLARIIAGMLKVPGAGLVEVDAARYSGIDQMRDLLISARGQGLDGGGRKFFIIDEAHGLSKQAWQTLLKATEEPPPHLYWALCTTEPDKVPKTIRTRAHAYDLKPVKWDLLSEFLSYVVQESPDVQIKPEFVDLVARAANGSVRQALVYLSVLDGIIDKGEALRLIESIDEGAETPALALARMLVSGRGATWANARKLLEAMADENPESIRLTILNYASAALLKSDSEKAAGPLLAIIQAFAAPCNPSERMSPILLAVGGLLLGG